MKEEKTEIGTTSPFPPDDTTEDSTLTQTKLKEHERRRKRSVSRMKSALPVVLVIIFWAAILAAVVMSILGNDYSDIPAGAGLGMVGLLLTFLGSTVIVEKKITDSFSDDPHALQETYVGKDAVMLGVFYIFLGILFLCGCGFVFYSRITN